MKNGGTQKEVIRRQLHLHTYTIIIIELCLGDTSVFIVHVCMVYDFVVYLFFAVYI